MLEHDKGRRVALTLAALQHPLSYSDLVGALADEGLTLARDAVPVVFWLSEETRLLPLVAIALAAEASDLNGALSQFASARHRLNDAVAKRNPSRGR